MFGRIRVVECWKGHDSMRTDLKIPNLVLPAREIEYTGVKQNKNLLHFATRIQVDLQNQSTRVGSEHDSNLQPRELPTSSHDGCAGHESWLGHSENQF